MTDPTRDELRRACEVVGLEVWIDGLGAAWVHIPGEGDFRIESFWMPAYLASRLVAMVRHMKKHTEYSQEMGSRYQCDLRRELLATDEQRTRAALEVLRAEAESES